MVQKLPDTAADEAASGLASNARPVALRWYQGSPRARVHQSLQGMTEGGRMRAYSLVSPITRLPKIVHSGKRGWSRFPAAQAAES